ncbi:MAG: methyltransferase domain-containing protein [Bacteroidota bacterium]
MYWLGLVLGEQGRAMHEWRERKGIAIFESSARGAYPMLLSEKFDYFETEYDPRRTADESSPRKYADIQKLQFGEGTFDIVIASDVFEHVRDDAAGYREVFRTLKQGGTLLLTVPYAHERPETIVRVRTDGEKDIFLLEPEYHGGGGQTLTYRNYGRDLLSLLRQTGFSVMYAVTDQPELGVPPMGVIIAQKSDFIELPPLPAAKGTMHRTVPLLPYRVFLLLKYNVVGFLRMLRQTARR